MTDDSPISKQEEKKFYHEVRKTTEEMYPDRHDFRFSHYEDEIVPGSTSEVKAKYVIIICRHCGEYLRHQIF